MCDTCNDKAIEILKMDFYSQISTKRDEVLDTEELDDAFGESFDEFIQNYAMFTEKVFRGQFDPDSIAHRQKQWEELLETLITQIEHGIPEEEEEGEDIEKAEPERVMPGVASIADGKLTISKRNPFSVWANKQE